MGPSILEAKSLSAAAEKIDIAARATSYPTVAFTENKPKPLKANAVSSSPLNSSPPSFPGIPAAGDKVCSKIPHIMPAGDFETAPEQILSV